MGVEPMGPPHGEESAFDIRIEGFNTPWLHIENTCTGRRFLFIFAPANKLIIVGYRGSTRRRVYGKVAVV